MTAERWSQVRDILYKASQIEGEARGYYLDEACGGDRQVRDEVEKLLLALDHSGSFLEPDRDCSLAVSQHLRIGPYLILEQAGHGGMGVVYHAVRDGDYRQEVAIKLVKAGADTDILISRFRLERQALALLNHPNIARLLDGGTTPDGRPYLVMEWVQGRAITDYCQDQKLTLRERLQLFLYVADAVAHAHRNLVIHRDLKPSNILITAEGNPKLLDFGIAKIFTPDSKDEPLTMTVAGAQMLTPDYASPEQVRGEAVNTATDVYSLGIVLYEILAGRRPLQFETRTPVDIERTVTTQEPALPSQAAQASGLNGRELRGDLDNIVLKAIQKEPQRRYATVSQFSDDLRRYLDGQPVVARKDTFVYRAGKFVRRHRTGVAAAGLVFIALTSGAATTLWQARVAIEERGRAERRFNDVRKLANSFLFEFYEAIDNLPGSTPARSLIVKRALEYLDGLAAEGRADSSLQMEIASAYERIAEVQGDPLFPNLGDSQGALASSTKALGIIEPLAQSEPGNVRVQLALASVHRQMGDIFDVISNSQTAIEHSAKALHIYEALAKDRGSDPQLQSRLAIQTYNHANRLLDSGNPDGAAESYFRASTLCARMEAAHPSEPEWKVHLAASLDGLGNALQAKGDTGGSLENRKKGLALREGLASSDPANAHYRRQLGFSHHNVGLSLMQAGDLAGALEHFRAELHLFELLSASDPKDAQGRRNVSLAHKQIGDVLMRLERFDTALAEFRKSLVIDSALSLADPANSQALLDLSFAEVKAGFALGKLDRYEESLATLRRGAARQELLVNKDPNDDLLRGHLSSSYTLLARCLLDSGQTEPAIDDYRKALDIRLRLAARNIGGNANRGALAECHMNLGKALAEVDLGDALEQYGKAVLLLEQLSASDANNAQVRIRLADTLRCAARLRVRMASANGGESSLRLQQVSQARSLYARSRDLWQDLERAGKLAGADRRAPSDVTRELANCDNTLARLLPER